MKVHRDLSVTKGRPNVVARESVEEAYKASEECAQDKRDYASMAYLFDRDEVQSKVLLKSLQLRLDFLDEISDKEEAAEDTTGPSNDQDQPSNTQVQHR